MNTFLNCISFLFFSGLILTGCQKEASLVTNNTVAPFADAGLSQAIQAPAASVVLEGKGTSQNGAISGYLWSLVSGPNVPLILSPGSPTTNVNQLITGTYIFQLMVVDNAGLTGVDTVQVIVLPSLRQTLTLQPSGNPTEMNFAINGVDSSGQDLGLHAAAWTGRGFPYYIRAALQFDLSSIPVTASIVSARLFLYSDPTPSVGNFIDANSGSNNAFYIRRITSAWSVASSNWSTQPTTTTTDQILIAHTDQTFLDLPGIDVTALVSKMHTTTNYGFWIQLQNEVAYNIRQFASSINPAADKHPKLIVTYE